MQGLRTGFADWLDDEWRTQADRFASMAAQLDSYPHLNTSFTALARDALVRAEHGRWPKLGEMREPDMSRKGHGDRGRAPGKPDLKYYRRRVTEEKAAALQASDLRVSRVHCEMARRYGDLVRSITSQENSNHKSLVGLSRLDDAFCAPVSL